MLAEFEGKVVIQGPAQQASTTDTDGAVTWEGGDVKRFGVFSGFHEFNYAWGALLSMVVAFLL